MKKTKKTKDSDVFYFLFLTFAVFAFVVVGMPEGLNWVC